MNNELRKRFEYHKANEEQIDKMKLIRELFIELANLIDDECPVSREKALALTNLETASFYANASIVRY